MENDKKLSTKFDINETKKLSAKGVMRELEKAVKNNENRTKKIAELKKQTKEENAKIKELEKLLETLRQEEWNNVITKEWVREMKLTDEQIKGALEFVRKKFTPSKSVEEEKGKVANVGNFSNVKETE